VEERRWTVARLDEVPTNAEIDGDIAGELYEGVKRRDPAAIQRWGEFFARDRSQPWRTHGVRRFFGITSFGAMAFEAAAGDPLTVTHDETAHGQEELYVVVRGRARFTLDDAEVEVGAGEAVFVRPEVRRGSVAVEDTLLLVVGGIPGRAYEPPTWASDWQSDRT
jgi:mannose-6-phosphate isomerase-like protein (cupin superfamily)